MERGREIDIQREREIDRGGDGKRYGEIGGDRRRER